MGSQIPSIKDRNIFWSSIMASSIVSLIGAFFVSSFFVLNVNYFDYGFLINFLIFLNSGIGLVIIFVYASKKIIKVI